MKVGSKGLGVDTEGELAAASCSTSSETIDVMQKDFKINNLQTFKLLDDPEALYAVLRTLQQEFKIKDPQTFMCNGVAARLDDPEALYAVLRVLQQEFRIKDLQTFMCNGVAARLDDPEALYAVLRVLQDEFKIKNLQTFMCDGVAAKLDDSVFWDAVGHLLADVTEPDELSITPAEASSLMQGVASRLDAALAQTIRRLKCAAMRLGWKAWMVLTRSPFTPHMTIIAEALGRGDLLCRKRTLSTLTRTGTTAEKRARVSSLACRG